MWICPGIGAACDVAFNHVYRLAFVYLIAVAMTLTIRELFHRSVPAVWALARDEFDAPADDRTGGDGLAPVTPLHRRG
jgi:hypothetical protein